MLTKARELSGAEDRHNGRKEARTRASRSSHIKHPSLPFWTRHENNNEPVRELRLLCIVATGKEAILTGGEGGWSRISAPISLRHPRVSLRQHGGSVEEQAARCMTGRDERERAVHCANRERRGGRAAPERSLCRDATVGCVFKNGVLFGSFVENVFFLHFRLCLFIYNPPS